LNRFGTQGIPCRVIAVLVVGSLLVLYETDAARTNATSTVTDSLGAFATTGSMVTSGADTYFPSNFECFPSVGGLEVRIVSDATGAPISGENLTAIVTLGVDCNGTINA
jgi:hypothetical protein